MVSYVKTTILLLVLLCVTKLIQAELVESTDKLKSSNDSKAVEDKVNVSESSTSKSLDEVESSTENVEKTTKNSAKGGEEKKESVIQDEIKIAEEKKGNHTLKRKRRSHISEIKKKSVKNGNSKHSVISGSTGKDEGGSDSNSSETYGSGEDKTVPHKGHEEFLNFLMTFLDDGCALIDSYSTLQNSIEEISALINDSEIGAQLNTDHIMSFLFTFKGVWEDYCDSPRKSKDALIFFHDVISKMTKIAKLDGSNEELDSVSQRIYNPSAVPMDFLNTNGETMRRLIDPKLIFTIIKSLTGGHKRSNKRGLSDVVTILTTLSEKYGDALGIPPPIREFTGSLMKGLVGGKRSNDALGMLTAVLDTYGDALHLPDDVKSVLAHLHSLESGKGNHNTRSEGGSNPFGMLSNYDGMDSEETELGRRSEDEGPSLEKVLQKYCELSVGSSNIISTLKALLKEFDVHEESDIGKRGNVDFMKFMKSLKTIVDKSINLGKRSGYEANFIKGIMEKYCEDFRRSNSALTSLTEVLVPQEGDNNKRSALLSSRKFYEEYISGSKGNGATLDYLKYFLAKYCGLPVPEAKPLNSEDINNDFQRTHTEESVKPKVRTKSNKIYSISEERRRKRSEYDDMIGWRHGVFEPDRNQTVSKTQTEKSSPRVIKKSKIRRLKKPKNLKNRIINLYNGKENGTRTRGHKGQLLKPRIVGYKENPSSSFEVKTGVERDMGSNDSNARLRCNVRTKASMSDADGRTGSSKGHTFSEIPSNDTKTLLCSSETSEVQRPNKDVYIKQSVSGKSVVSYDSPDKYIRQNYSPSKENLEIGTSGSSALNDTSSKNQSVSVVSTDSQNADSISRSETKFVQGKGDSRGMESSANVEGSIDVVSNKNPFITNSRQHSLGMVVENPDKNMESPIPVEKNEKLQTYSKFQRTEDFDINFRRFDPERSHPEFHHRRRPR